MIEIAALLLIGSRRPGYLCACNVHTVMTSGREDSELSRARAARLPTAQRPGRPAARMGTQRTRPPPDPVASTAPSDPERAPRQPRRADIVFDLYGGRNQGALVQLALNLRQRHPGIRIVGGYSPPHRHRGARQTEESSDGLPRPRSLFPCRRWRGLFFLGIGVPKQEKWMAEMRSRLRDAAARRRRRGVRLPCRPGAAGAELDPGVWSGVGISPRPRAAPAVEAVPAPQPAVPRVVRPQLSQHRRITAPASAGPRSAVAGGNGNNSCCDRDPPSRRS